MHNLTQNEQNILKAITDYCMMDYSVDVNDLARMTTMSKSSIKGVVGSLAKKGRVLCEEEYRGDRLFNDIFPVNSKGETLSFGNWS